MKDNGVREEGIVEFGYHDSRLDKWDEHGRLAKSARLLANDEATGGEVQQQRDEEDE